MKRYLISPLLVLTVTGALAQNPVVQTVVLDDGSRITGTIISDSSGFIIMKVTRPSYLLLNKSRVISVGKPAEPDFPPGNYSGYNMKFQAGILAGNSDEGKVYSPYIHLTSGYRFAENYEINAGTGIEFFNVALVPVYTGFCYYLTGSRSELYFRINGGYAFPVSEYRPVYTYYSSGTGKTRGGLIIDAGIGTALWSWKGNAVTMELGYRFQRITFRSRIPFITETTTREIVTDYKRIEIRFGFIFR